MAARLGLLAVSVVLAIAASQPAAGHAVFDRPRCVSPTVRTPDNHCCPPNESHSPACKCCRSLPAVATACVSGKAPLEKCLEAGEMYDYGPARDAKRAADMFEKACARGSAIGCVRLAHFFEDGKGRPADLAQALRLYEKACAGKVSCACVFVGAELSKPAHTGTEARRGVSLLKRACDGGDLLACRWLARRYQEGHGVEQSAEKAAALRERACTAKVRDACDGVDPVDPRDIIFHSVCRPGRISISLTP